MLAKGTWIPKNVFSFSFYLPASFIFHFIFLDLERVCHHGVFLYTTTEKTGLYFKQVRTFRKHCHHQCFMNKPKYSPTVAFFYYIILILTVLPPSPDERITVACWDSLWGNWSPLLVKLWRFIFCNMWVSDGVQKIVWPSFWHLGCFLLWPVNLKPSALWFILYLFIYCSYPNQYIYC